MLGKKKENPQLEAYGTVSNQMAQGLKETLIYNMDIILLYLLETLRYSSWDIYECTCMYMEIIILKRFNVKKTQGGKIITQYLGR